MESMKNYLFKMDYTVTDHDTTSILESSDLSHSSIFASILTDFFAAYHIRVLTEYNLYLEMNMVFRHNNMSMEIGKTIIKQDNKYISSPNKALKTYPPVPEGTNLILCLKVLDFQDHDDIPYGLVHLAAFNLEDECLMQETHLYELVLSSTGEKKESLSCSETIRFLNNSIISYRKEMSEQE